MAERATVTFHTSPAVKARLEKLARLTRRSRSYLTNEAVERYLQEEEAFILAVEEGLAQADAGLTVPQEDVAAWAESLGTHKPRPRPEPKAR